MFLYIYIMWLVVAAAVLFKTCTSLMQVLTLVAYT